MGFSYRLDRCIASAMDVSELAADLSELMARQLRVRAGPLADVAARAGRKLPNHLRKEVIAITEAETLAAHPKLSHRVDIKRLRKAERKLHHFLNKKDPKAERRAEFLDRLAFYVFVVFSAIVAVFLFAVWRGAFE
ncbi:MAG: hypothetical protein AAF718_14710 [Pseudomonadota bacterium]